MTVLNDLDRFHLVMDTIGRVPQTGERGIYLKKQLRDKLIEHKRYIDLQGGDLPEIRNWMWGAKRVGGIRLQICRRTRNWVRLGGVDLFFFITAAARGRRKGLEPGLSVPRWLCVN
jgi:XFP C-terminal domain